MSALIIDIETIGEDFQTLDEKTQDILTRWIKKESYNDQEYKVALDDLKNGLGFSPLTGKIVAIGAFDNDFKKGHVLFDAPNQKIEEQEIDNITYTQVSEKEMLEKFWKTVENYDEIITFNGRAFDIPFLIIRSAVHKIKISKNLMTNRYQSYQKSGQRHIDLMDELSFYGAVRKKGNLHLYCRAFGIVSPKAEGITGDDVGQLYKQEKYLDIAKYNGRDLIATDKLFETWKNYININI
jgi:DNA polymerase elongation subunit (family B)